MKRAWPMVLVLLAGCATIRSLFLGDRPPFIPVQASRISGAYSRAAGVAFEDWMAYRAEGTATREALEDAGIFKLHPEARAVDECYNRPEAYQTWIWPSDAGTSYIVYILGQDDVCFPKEEGPPYYGDFMTYEIDAKTFKILKRQVEERLEPEK